MYKVNNLNDLPADVLTLLDNGPAYQQPWFKNIAAEGHPVIVPVATLDGVPVACLPLAVRYQRGIFACGDNASCTHVSGLVFAKGLEQSQIAEAVRQLVRPLWRISVKIVCDPSPDSAVLVEAFKAAGFHHETQKTHHEYPDDPHIMDPDNECGLGKRHRNNIRRAERQVVITESVTAKEFMRFYVENIKNKGIACYENPVTLLNIIEAGQSLALHDRAIVNSDAIETLAKRLVVFGAREKSLQIDNAAPLAAAIACLFDNKTCRYWLTSRPQDGGHSDVIKALVLRARDRARELKLTFDADGVSTNGSKVLYELMKIPHVKNRDIFMRRSYVDQRDNI